MEAGIVDEDQSVGPLLLKETIGHVEELPEARQVGKHGGYSDHGEIAERIEQTTAGGGHALAAEAVDFDPRLAAAQSVKEVSAVKIAAGFARADEQTHEKASLPLEKEQTAVSGRRTSPKITRGRAMEASPERCKLVVRTALPVQRIAAIFGVWYARAIHVTSHI
jgi:hypothetical protein